MIAYWIKLICYGCTVTFHLRPVVTILEDIPQNHIWLLEAAKAAGWIVDAGGEHFCPQCQIQRGVESQPDAGKKAQPLKSVQ